MDIKQIIKEQEAFFKTGSTIPVKFRKTMLRELAIAIRRNEKEIDEALKEDMNKSPAETYLTETGMVIEEIRYHLKNIDKWARAKRVRTPLSQFPAVSFRSPYPIGRVLIMAPWNYPVNLSLMPLVGAISAGCTAVVKPSALAPASSAVIAKILGDTFNERYIAVVEGGREENSQLLEEKFDHIFFTGSPQVGHVVMEAAAKNLTPVTLELGGKSPVIVDDTANIKLAAKRIAFGKVLNAGQTCVEPDYMFIHRDVKETFIYEFRKALEEFFPDGDMSDMNVIINEKHYERVKRLLGCGRCVLGGGFDDERRFIEPTLLEEVNISDPVMQEEIFGPVLPMLVYRELDTCIEHIQANEAPLSLYLFSRDKAAMKRILSRCQFGGGCINDTIVHTASSYMPFGGVGNSGMGGYHGKASFDTFTHYRSILKKSNRLDLSMRYRPYTKDKEEFLRAFIGMDKFR